MRKFILVIVECLALLLLSLQAQATLVYFDFSGTITEVRDDLDLLKDHNVAVGGDYSGVMVYDTETPPLAPPRDHVYSPILGGMIFEIGDIKVVCGSLLGIMIDGENHSMSTISNGETYDPQITWGGGGILAYL
jgi:hypothetical protein